MFRIAAFQGMRGAVVLFCWLLVAGVLGLSPAATLLASLMIPFLVGVAATRAYIQCDSANQQRAVFTSGLAALLAGAAGGLAGKTVIDYLVSSALQTPLPLILLPPEFYAMAYLLLGLLGGTTAAAGHEHRQVQRARHKLHVRR